MNDQTGQMRASAGGAGGVERALELPVVMRADRAKALVEGALARRWAERDRLVVQAGPASMRVEPGTTVRVEGSEWRVEQVVIDQLVTKLQLVSQWGGIASAAADPGRVTSSPDDVASPTLIALFNLPDLSLQAPGVPAVHIAACQPTAPYRAVQLSVSGGGEPRVARSAAQEAVLGRAVTALPDGQSAVFDFANSFEVELDDAEHWLQGRDDDALINGANLAAIGDELIQFGAAEPIGQRRFRLSRLLRGRRGTEWAMASHLVGEPFCLLTRASLVAVDGPLEMVGTSIEVRPNGLADDNHPGVSTTMSGEALRPPSPVRLRVARNGASLSLSWTRRSRLGWTWVDEIDAPVGETTERYRVEIAGTSGSSSAQVDEAHLEIGPDAMDALGSGLLVISVTQVGDYALSRPLSGSVLL